MHGCAILQSMQFCVGGILVTKSSLIHIISGKNLCMSEKLRIFALEIVNYSCYE